MLQHIVLGSGDSQATSGYLTGVYSGVWLPRIQSSSHCHETTVNSSWNPLYVLLVPSAAQLYGINKTQLSLTQLQFHITLRAR